MSVKVYICQSIVSVVQPSKPIIEQKSEDPYFSILFFTLPLINITQLEHYLPRHVSHVYLSSHTEHICSISGLLNSMACLRHIVHIIYFEFLVGVTHAPVLSSSRHHFGNICPLFDPVTTAFRPFRRIQDSSWDPWWDSVVGCALSTLQLRIGTFLGFVRLTDLRENPSACS